VQTPPLLHSDQTEFSISFSVPASLTGRTIYCQALEVNNTGFSGWTNPLAVVVL
jgi:hypothetical protein